MTEPEDSDLLKRHMAIFSGLLAKMPSNVLDRPFFGNLAVMEVIRILTVARASQVPLAHSDGQTILPLQQVEGITESIPTVRLNERSFSLDWAIFHRGGLPAFAHILLALREESSQEIVMTEAAPTSTVKSLVLLAPLASPLVEPEALRFLNKHFQAVCAGSEEIKEFYRELDGIVTFIQQGGAEGIGGAEGDPPQAVDDFDPHPSWM